MNSLKPYFSFRGRTNRLRYWITTIVLYGITLALSAVASVAAPAAPWLALVVLLLLAPILVADVALMVRRLHDRNRPGWLAAVFFGVGVFASVIQEIVPEDSLILIPVALLVVVVVIWGFAELAILKGTTGPNRFGEDPLQPQVAPEPQPA